MAYRFELNEPLVEATRRIGAQQIERAMAALRAVGDRPTAIHDTRKSMKRIRALLCLARPALAERVFRHENERYRAIAELLSGTRDTEVLQATLARLQADTTATDRKSIATMARLLAGSSHDHAASTTHVREAVARLEKAKKAITELPLADDGYAAVFEGMEATYRRGRKAMSAAVEHPGDEAHHEWRKQVQRHWRHMALLSRAWPAAMEARVAVAKELSEVLGDDHDLTVLTARIEGVGSDKVRAAVTRAARAAQDELRARALPLGERLYAARPAGMRREIALYWHSACELARRAQEAGAHDAGDAAPPMGSPTSPPASPRNS